MSLFVLHTYGILEHPDDHPATQAFFETTPAVLASRENAAGMLRGDTAAFTSDGRPRKETSEFGGLVTPHFYDSSVKRISLVTLSVWTDPESAAGYSYHGTHGDAFRKRSEWFRQDHPWPSSVLWWTDDIESVNWNTANEKLAHLDEHGASPEAFSFRSMYTSTGEETRMNNERVKEIGKSTN